MAVIAGGRKRKWAESPPQSAPLSAAYSWIGRSMLSRSKSVPITNVIAAMRARPALFLYEIDSREQNRVHEGNERHSDIVCRQAQLR
jgi:hypothetical protein